MPWALATRRMGVGPQATVGAGLAAPAGIRPITRRILHGALSGAIGAGCMTVLRMLAHRARLIDQMVPQAVETWAKHHAPVRMLATPSESAVHHIADQL